MAQRAFDLPLRATLREGDAFLQQHHAWLTQQLHLHACTYGEHCVAMSPPPYRCAGSAALALGTGAGNPRATGCRRHAALSGVDAGRLRHSASGSAAGCTEAQGRADLGRWLPRCRQDCRASRDASCSSAPARCGARWPRMPRCHWIWPCCWRPSAFEYVVVHELCHLLHANHSPQFWQAVGARFPAVAG